MNRLLLILLTVLGVNNNLFSQQTNNAQTNEFLQIVAPTNSLVNYMAELSNIQFGKAFRVEYTMPSNIIKIIDIHSNIKALADTGISIDFLGSTNVQVSVTPYGLAPYPMPSLLVSALDQEGTTNIFYTPGFTIPISNVIESNAKIEFADIQPPYFAWDPFWTIMIFILLFIIGLIIFLSSIKRSPLEKVVLEIPINPFEVVHKKLENLKIRSKSLTDETYKEFFVELSEAVREFLSHTVLSVALETPTRELLTILKNHKTDQELMEVITFVLRNSDRAKYAKQVFAEDQINAVIEESFALTAIIKKQRQMENTHELRK